MPRAFTDEERERIRASLIAAGRKCFAKFGMRKTTLMDLVSTAGIAKSTFYQFYTSKEGLYHDLFAEEIPAMMARLRAASIDSTDNTRDALVLLMRATAREIESNELARLVLDDPTQLERFLATPEYGSLLQRIEEGYAPMVEWIEAAQARGEIIPRDPHLIANGLGLAKLIAIHKENMPAKLYEALIDFVPEVMADGLTLTKPHHPAMHRELNAEEDSANE